MSQPKSLDPRRSFYDELGAHNSAVCLCIRVSSV